MNERDPIYEEWERKEKEAIEKLSDYGFNLIDDAEAMKVLFDWGQLAIPPLTVCLTGVDDDIEPPESALPMRIQVRHDQHRTLVHEFDPIGMFIDSATEDGFGNPVPFDESTRQRFDKAIAALQSGIDRLKAYEARRIKAQS